MKFQETHELGRVKIGLDYDSETDEAKLIVTRTISTIFEGEFLQVDTIDLADLLRAVRLA